MTQAFSVILEELCLNSVLITKISEQKANVEQKQESMHTTITHFSAA